MKTDFPETQLFQVCSSHWVAWFQIFLHFKLHSYLSSVLSPELRNKIELRSIDLKFLEKNYFLDLSAVYLLPIVYTTKLELKKTTTFNTLIIWGILMRQHWYLKSFKIFKPVFHPFFSLKFIVWIWFLSILIFFVPFRLN